ncbi:MAG: AMP-binding protein, partial [Flavobacteriales bacterium]
MELSLGIQMIRRIDFSDPQWSITRTGWDAFDKQVLDCIQQWMDDSNTLRVLTSGTTGAQRVLHIPKEWVIQSARRTMTALGLKDGYHAHLCLPLDFIAGKMVVWRTMVAQGVLSWEEPTSSPHFDLQATADIASVTPHQMHAMLQKYSGTVWPMRKLLIGGGPMSPALRVRLPLEPIECYETYGMAESISHIALRSLSDTESWFKPMQDVELSVDERACLKIHIPYFDDLKIQTQDVVELRPTGEFRWLGRADWVINSGG